MKIRYRLLVILLSVAIAPLVLSSVFHRLALHGLGSHLAAETRQMLEQNARHQLQDLVEDYQRILRRDKEMLELAMHFQAHMTEDAIAKGEPSSALMSEVFQRLRAARPDLILRQYTLLETGDAILYPEIEPPLSISASPWVEWYSKTVETGKLSWHVLPKVGTTPLHLLASLPVKTPDGKVAGVTAMEVSPSSAFQEIALPESWAREAEVFLVRGEETKKTGERRLVVVLRNRQLGAGRVWETPAQEMVLSSPDDEAFAELVEEVFSGRPAVNMLRLGQRDSLWAYGGMETGETFPIIIVPVEQVVARAIAAERYVLSATRQGLHTTGALLFVVIVVAGAAAFLQARAVSTPVRQLAECAQRLAQGDFDVQVDIRSGGELEELGNHFNRLGPQLLERERMKQALSLAREVQQHLLPVKMPSLPGIEIYGQSRYCDETGGDYFDFLTWQEGEANNLGLVVGDVSGHGLGAALLMASARGTLRAMAGMPGLDLKAQIETLNLQLAQDTDDSEFMTFFFGILNIRNHQLHWCSAGHGPVLKVGGGDGEVVELPTTGPPLGIFEDALFALPEPLPLAKGDILVIGTDGLWEAQNPTGEMFGIQHLKEVVSAHRAGSAEQVFQAVADEVRSFVAGRVPEDDMTLVVLKIA